MAQEGRDRNSFRAKRPSAEASTRDSALGASRALGIVIPPRQIIANVRRLRIITLSVLISYELHCTTQCRLLDPCMAANLSFKWKKLIFLAARHYRVLLIIAESRFDFIFYEELDGFSVAVLRKFQNLQNYS